MCAHEQDQRLYEFIRSKVSGHHGSDARSEQGLPTPRCLNEEQVTMQISLLSPHTHAAGVHTAILTCLSASNLLSCRSLHAVRKLQIDCIVGIASSPLIVSNLHARLHTYAPLLFYAVCGVECSMFEGRDKRVRGMLFRSPTNHCETGMDLVCISWLNSPATIVR